MLSPYPELKCHVFGLHWRALVGGRAHWQYPPRVEWTPERARQRFDANQPAPAPGPQTAAAWGRGVEEWGVALEALADRRVLVRVPRAGARGSVAYAWAEPVYAPSTHCAYQEFVHRLGGRWDLALDAYRLRPPTPVEPVPLGEVAARWSGADAGPAGGSVPSEAAAPGWVAFVQHRVQELAGAGLVHPPGEGVRLTSLGRDVCVWVDLFVRNTAFHHGAHHCPTCRLREVDAPGWDPTPPRGNRGRMGMPQP